MNYMNTQKENVNHLLQLIKDNPDLEILPMVSTDIIASDDFNSWMGQWGSAEIDEYYCSDERIYFKSEDFDELVDEFMDNNYLELEYKNLTDEEFEKVANDAVDKYEWVKAIVVHIVTP